MKEQQEIIKRQGTGEQVKMRSSHYERMRIAAESNPATVQTIIVSQPKKNKLSKNNEKDAHLIPNFA